jgi:hypothetical protein
MALGGAALAGLGLLIEWVQDGGKAFDIPASFLFDYKVASKSSLSIGLVVALFAAVVLLSAILPNPGLRTAGRWVGRALTAVGVVFIVQLFRFVQEAHASLSDVMGPAPFVVAIAGVLAALQK